MFKYNAETNEIIWDNLPIGGLDGKTIVLTANLAGPQKGKLKKYLIEEGYEIEGFRKAEGGEEEDEQEQSVASAIPEQDPQLGDKTPAVVEWYRDNEPAEYQRRYKNRKTHLGRI